MANGRAKRRKKVRYSEIRIRLSYKQRRSLINYCNARQTTPNKLIKKMIRKYISNFADDVPEEYYATENQLELFSDNREEDFEVEIMEEVEEENGWNNEDRSTKIEDRETDLEEENDDLSEMKEPQGNLRLF